MTWNWQQQDWPKFQYNSDQFADLEAEFWYQAGLLNGAVQHIPEEDKTLLIVDLISDESIKTSEIEGEYLNRDSVQSSIRRHFGLSTITQKISPAEQGIAGMMVDVYQTFDQPLSHSMLHHWHALLMQSRDDVKEIGSYRTHADPMQVVSGPIHKPNVHFEAPPSKNMQKEMDVFIHWFNAQATSKSLSPLTAASIIHLYFVCIHPFEDGNGRIGRALVEKLLAQRLSQPTLIALSQTIQMHRKDYYEFLEKNNKSTEITSWIVYFSKTILSAQQFSRKLIHFLIEKTKFYDRHSNTLNERQKKVIARIFAEGTEGFRGGLSSKNYISITGTSKATATRDLQDLVQKKALKMEGKLKSARYYLNIGYVDK